MPPGIILIEGITGRAIKLRVIKGSTPGFAPRAKAADFAFSSFLSIISIGSPLIIPAMGRGSSATSFPSSLLTLYEINT